MESLYILLSRVIEYRTHRGARQLQDVVDSILAVPADTLVKYKLAITDWASVPERYTYTVVDMPERSDGPLTLPVLLSTYCDGEDKLKVKVIVNDKLVDLENLYARWQIAITAETVEAAKQLIRDRIAGSLTSLTEAIHEAEDKLMNNFGEAEEVMVPEGELGPEGCPSAIWNELLSYGMTPLQTKKAWVLCHIEPEEE